MPIDLAQPRVLAFSDRGRSFTLTCKPITPKMWLEYFAGIVSTQSLDEDGNTVSQFDASGARLQLLEDALIACTGYDGDTGKPVMEARGWQGKLPMAHRRAAADMLLATEQDPDAGFEFELGLEAVVLRSTWTADDEGRMQQVRGLKHYFNSPRPEHQTRFSRAMSRTVVTGGRNGETRFLGAQDELIALYDDLIVRTEGYTHSSGTVPEDMDAYHKVVAAQLLFTPVKV